jgi:Putative addiction module component
VSDLPSIPSASREAAAVSTARLRHFSLSTLLLIVGAYGVLLGVLAALRMPPIITLDIAIFVTAVGLAQAFLFGGRKPRRASVISGGVVACLLAGGQTYWYLLDSKYPEGVAWAPYVAIAATIIGAVHGIIFGYIVGRLIGLLFVWGDLMHRAIINEATFQPSDRVLAEFERRWAEYESGKIEAVPWEEVRAEIRRKLANKR